MEVLSMKIILGSSSPRRQSLLKQVGISFEVEVPNVDEKLITSTDPQTKVIETARLKADALQLPENTTIITGDTVVSFNNEIFEKPTSKEEARKMINAISGNTHEVYSAAIIKSRDFEEKIISKASVSFFSLSHQEIEDYINTDEPYDKARAYGIQDFGASFVESIQGDYYTIVGLPIARVYRALKKHGLYLFIFFRVKLPFT